MTRSLLTLLWLMPGICLLTASMSLAREFSVDEVAPGVYVHQGSHEQMNLLNQGDINNSGFIVGRNAVAVIDPGGSVSVGAKLRRYLESVTDVPVKYIVLTHFHPDHVLGAAAFSKDVEILAHRNYPRAVTQRAVFYRERFAELVGGSPDAFRQPDRTIQSVETIDLGDRMLQLEAHPVAHTDNDLSVLDLSTGTWWASDLVFSDRTPALDGSLSGWLQLLTDRDQDTIKLIVPGHGAPGDWQSTVEPQEQYLRQIQSTVRAQIAEGLSISEVVAAAESEENSGEAGDYWRLFDEQHPTNLIKAYTELEWE
ncbi:MAG: quinoprotein relay system zinc metallohydrolase 2 [Granulosicoccus sp.]|nr:quinoprotein relay system zinc metallohydrolase 2 [Granulosicoccus sp.]